MTAGNSKPCFVNSLRINHFERKPVKGGKPPREKRVRGVIEVKNVVLAQEVASELIEVEDEW